MAGQRLAGVLRTFFGGHMVEQQGGFGVPHTIAVGEFGVEKLQCYPDPVPKTDKLAANPAHAYADFRAFSPKEGKNIGKRLRNIAVKRGCLHPPA